MEMEFDFKAENFEKKLSHLIDSDFIKKAMYRAGTKTEINAKEIINNFENAKGNKQGVDSGGFRDTIHVEELEDGFGFKMKDGVPYGIYHEFGTEKHFVPFFDQAGQITSLGQWAARHFGELNFIVEGKRGQPLKKPSRKSRLEVLKAKRGLMVSLDEMAPFRKALEETNRNIDNIFEEEFEWQMKQ